MGPCVEEKSLHGHAQRAVLGDAAWVQMGFAKTATHSVVEEASRVEVGISTKGTSREASNLKKADEQPKLDLVEALEDVGTGTTYVLALQLGILKLEVDQVPSIFSTKWRRGTSKKGSSLSGLDPRGSAPQSGNTPDAVANREQRQASVPLGVQVVFPLAQEGCPRLFEKLRP